MFMDRVITRSASDVANYRSSWTVDRSSFQSLDERGSSSGAFDVGAGTHDVNATFSFTRNGGADTNGFSLNRVVSCNTPVGSETSANYGGFSQDTSMAAPPHVTGSAALLKSYRA